MKSKSLQPDRYIELGGGSAAKAKTEKEWIIPEITRRCTELKALKMFDDYFAVNHIARCGFRQEYTPYFVYVTEAQYKALSRAFRVEAYRLEGQAREDAMQGKGIRAYGKFMNIVTRSRKIQMRKQDVGSLHYERWRKASTTLR